MLLSAGSLVTSTVMLIQAVPTLNEQLYQGGWGNILKENSKNKMVLRCFTKRKCQPYLFKGIAYYSNAAWAFGGFLALAAACVGFFAAALPNYKDKAPGGSDWSNSNRMKKWVSPKGKRYGYLGYALDTGKLITYPGQSLFFHTVMPTNSGGGKTSKMMLPKVLSSAKQGISEVIIDMKGDLKSGFMLAPLMYEHYGHDVQMFMPFSASTMGWNLLWSDMTLEQASELAEMVRPRSGTGNAGVDYHKNNERELVQALIYGVSHSANGSISDLFEIINTGEVGVRSYIKNHPLMEVQQTASGFESMSSTQLQGLLSGLKAELSIFVNKNVARATSSYGQQVDLHRLFEKPGLLYIKLPEKFVRGGKAQVLLQLLLMTIQKTIWEYTDQRASASLPIPLVIRIDEKTNLGRIPNFVETITTMRSRNVCYEVAFQNMKQGFALYGEKDWNAILEAFGVTLFLPKFMHAESQKYYSEMLGEMTVLSTKITRSRGPMMFDFTSHRHGVAEAEDKRPLLAVHEMEQMDEHLAVVKNYDGKMQVVLPYLSQKSVVVAHPETGQKVTIKNTLYRDFARIVKGVAPEAIWSGDKDKADEAVEILGRRVDRLIDRVCGTTDEKLVEAEGGALVNPEVEFPMWFKKLLELHAQMHVKDRIVLHITERIPSELKSEVVLKEFEKRDYLQFKTHEENQKIRVEITQKGMSILAGVGGGELHREARHREVSGPLFEWIHQNRTHIKDHPECSVAQGSEFVGELRQDAVLISKTEIKNLFNEKVISLLATQRVGTKNMCVVPLSSKELYEMVTDADRRHRAMLAQQSPYTVVEEAPKKGKTSGAVGVPVVVPVENKKKSKNDTLGFGVQENNRDG
ncbi:hypothetical protein GCM10008938_37760 [Deinococcus roseus]|uniref:Type IV secretion system protein VirD4 n=2 Tax=Deinococcus roseus TaxID=392414 RepID=A0ABQ2DAY1_9DEIO|nr:hypothetical protein GCM10008938_37760 [Deinococcus roseus]